MMSTSAKTIAGPSKSGLPLRWVPMIDHFEELNLTAEISPVAARAEPTRPPTSRPSPRGAKNDHVAGEQRPRPD
jgi:hypothetical protein